MKKLLLAVGFSVTVGLLTGVTTVRAKTKMENWESGGSWFVVAEDGYPKNIQEKDEESEVSLNFVVGTPYAHETVGDTYEAMYAIDNALLLMINEDGYASAAAKSTIEALNHKHTRITGTVKRLPSGQNYKCACLVSGKGNMNALGLSFPPEGFAAHPTPPTVKTNGTDVPGRNYFKYGTEANVLVEELDAGTLTYLQGGGTAMVGGAPNYTAVTADNPCLSYDLGSPFPAVVIHTPAGTPGRIEFPNLFDSDTGDIDAAFCNDWYKTRVWVKDWYGVSKASTQVVRAYVVSEPSVTIATDYVSPYPYVVRKTAADPISFNVPQNKQ